MSLGGVSDSQGLDIGRANALTCSGIVNLGAVGAGGGTITTNIVRHSGAAATGTFNFHGGTLQAQTFANATFMNGLSNAYVYGEGGTIDNNGASITIAQPLLAPPATASLRLPYQVERVMSRLHTLPSPAAAATEPLRTRSLTAAAI